VKPKIHVNPIHVRMVVLVQLVLVPVHQASWETTVKAKTHVTLIHVRMAVLVQMVIAHAQLDS